MYPFDDRRKEIDRSDRTNAFMPYIAFPEPRMTQQIMPIFVPFQEHGCCPDGVTKAKGSDFKGCKNATPCKDAKWGCCEGTYASNETEVR